MYYTTSLDYFLPHFPGLVLTLDYSKCFHQSSELLDKLVTNPKSQIPNIRYDRHITTK